MTAAMGLNGAQEAIASAAIATAISRAAAAEGVGGVLDAVCAAG